MNVLNCVYYRYSNHVPWRSCFSPNLSVVIGIWSVCPPVWKCGYFVTYSPAGILMILSTGGYDAQWGFLIHVKLKESGVHGLVKKVRLRPIDRVALDDWLWGFGLSVTRLFFIRSTHFGRSNDSRWWRFIVIAVAFGWGFFIINIIDGCRAQRRSGSSSWRIAER